MINLHFILNEKIQGQVMDKIDENNYMCDFFSWIDGSHSYSKILNIEELRECIFFQSIEHQENYCRSKKICGF